MASFQASFYHPSGGFAKKNYGVCCSTAASKPAHRGQGPEIQRVIQPSRKRPSGTDNPWPLV